jgi:transcriptional regulator with XRE-family HTH domain
LIVPLARTAADALRTARQRAGLTQRELAERALTAQSVVARIERGQTDPSSGTLQRLLRATGHALVLQVEPTVALDAQLLDDVPRIRALSPEDRLREVANLNRFVAVARRG